MQNGIMIPSRRKVAQIGNKRFRTENRKKEIQKHGIEDRQIYDSQRFSCWIDKEFTQENGKVGRRRVSGYFRDFGALLDDFIDTRIKESDATTVKQALAEIDSALKDAKKIAREAVKADFHIVRTKEKEK